MTTSTLQISTRYDYDFLKTVVGITPTDPQGTGTVNVPGQQLVYFPSDKSEAFLAAIENYDDDWLVFRKRARIEEVAAARKNAVENTFVFGGLPIKMDPDTENALGKAHAAMTRRPEIIIDWEVSRGNFIVFDLAMVSALSDAAWDHVQACFANARRLTDLVNSSADLVTLEAVVLDGWPE